MREIVHSALRALNLDYAITLISGGASRNYEVVMWDQPRNSFFSIRVCWETGLSRKEMTRRVVQQLTERSAAWRIADARGLAERRCRRSAPGSGCQTARRTDFYGSVSID